MDDSRNVPRGQVSWFLPFADDPAAQAFVAAHPHGADVAEIAAAMGLRPPTVYRELERALAKMRANQRNHDDES